MSWEEETKVTANDATPGALFGAAVDIQEDVAVVGAYNAEAGRVYVFQRHQSAPGIWQWPLRAILTPSDGAIGDDFGQTVAIDGDWICVGARAHDHHDGAVYAYQRPVTGWADATETQKLLPPIPDTSSSFGEWVAINNEVLVVGELEGQGASRDTGAAHVYLLSGAWSYQALLYAAAGETRGTFGGRVAIDGDVIAVSASSFDSTGAQDRGAIYVFEKPSGGWATSSQSAGLLASDGAANVRVHGSGLS